MKLRVVCDSLQKVAGPNGSAVTFRPVIDDEPSDNAKIFSNQAVGTLNFPVSSADQVEQFVLGAIYEIEITQVGQGQPIGAAWSNAYAPSETGHRDLPDVPADHGNTMNQAQG